MVASLQEEEQDLAKFFPLFLTGGAFNVYQTLKKSTKADYETAKKAMLKAFSNDSYGAYDELMSRRLRHHESVDVYIADLQRLIVTSSKQPRWS